MIRFIDVHERICVVELSVKFHWAFLSLWEHWPC